MFFPSSCPSPVSTRCLLAVSCLVLTYSYSYSYHYPTLPCSFRRRDGRAAKLATAVRFGGVGDIQANLVRAEKSQLVGRDREGASLLMHAAQRGETEVFRVVLDFLAEKLTPQEASFDFGPVVFIVLEKRRPPRLN